MRRATIQTIEQGNFYPAWYTWRVYVELGGRVYYVRVNEAKYGAFKDGASMIIDADSMRYHHASGRRVRTGSKVAATVERAALAAVVRERARRAVDPAAAPERTCDHPECPAPWATERAGCSECGAVTLRAEGGAR